MDREYWDDFYSAAGKGYEIDKPSRFAEEVFTHMKKGKHVVDLGCGNGRDSLYFASQGLLVTAIDMSETAISSLQKQDFTGKIKAHHGDFTDTGLMKEASCDYLYSRFTIHAITARQEDSLLQNAYRALVSQGLFFIEVRSVKDDIFGKGDMVERNAFIFNDHFRRFIVREELEQSLLVIGFKILSSLESRGLAVHKTEDPVIIRIIAQK